MTEKERKKLAAQRKKELAERELEQGLYRDLRLEGLKNEQNAVREQNENKFVTAATLFFGTLGPLYLLLFAAKFFFMKPLGGGLDMLGVNMTWIYPLLHGAIWIAAVVSVYRKRSVLDDIRDRFF